MEKELLIEFLEWIEDNVDDIFDIVDNQDKVIEAFLKDRD